MLPLIAVPLTAGARKVELSFDSPAYHTGKRVTFVAIAVVALAVARMAVRSQLRRPSTGREGMVGEEGEAATDIDGLVRFAASQQIGFTVVLSLFERRAAGLYHNTAAIVDGARGAQFLQTVAEWIEEPLALL